MKLNKKAFTLAELMLVFTAIGILTAILMPILFHATPNKAEMKAKKAYHTFAKSIEALVNEEPYSVHGGSLAAGKFPEFSEQLEYRCIRNAHGCDILIENMTDEEMIQAGALFCNNLSDVLNVKYADCAKRIDESHLLSGDAITTQPTDAWMSALTNSQVLLITGNDEVGNAVTSREEPIGTIMMNPAYRYESLQGAPFNPDQPDDFDPYHFADNGANNSTIDGICDQYFMDEQNRNPDTGELNGDYRNYYSFITSDNTGWVVQNFTFGNIEKPACWLPPGSPECTKSGKSRGELRIAGKNVPTAYGIVCVNTGDLRNIDVEPVPGDNNQLHASTVYGMAVNRDGRIILGGRLQKLLDDDSDSENNN